MTTQVSEPWHYDLTGNIHTLYFAFVALKAYPSAQNPKIPYFVKALGWVYDASTR